jgi:hypothetical protein
MELRNGDAELWAEVEFTPPAAEAIRKKEYRFVSPSFVKDYVWKNGKNIGTTLIAAAITNHPFLEGMEAITLSNDLGELAVPAADGVAPPAKGAVMEVGQRVSVKAEFATVPGLAGQPLEIVEVVGVGDDAFAKVQALGASAPVGWFRVSELEPAAAPVAPEQAAPAEAAPQEVSMSETFKLRDTRGQEIEVKADGLQSFVDQQIAAAIDAKTKEIVPEGSVVINASKLQEFETSAKEVTSLRSEVTSLRDEAETAKKDKHVMVLSNRLQKMQEEGKITRPQREYALKTFADPTQIGAFDEWAKTFTAKVVRVGEEHGSGAGEDAPERSADGELLQLASKRAAERGISLRDAISQISREKPELVKRYELSNRTAAERAIH